MHRHIEEVVSLKIGSNLFCLPLSFILKNCSYRKFICKNELAGGMVLVILITGCKKHTVALYTSEVCWLQIAYQYDVSAHKLFL